MRIDTIYLDMDGVCVDFVKKVCTLYGLPSTRYHQLMLDWPYLHPFEWNIEVILDTSEYNLWKMIDDAGIDFWRDLVPYNWFKFLYDELSAIAPVYFLTKPSRNPDCVAGKLLWLQDRFGPKFRDYIFTPHKHLLAQSGTVLIDDKISSIKSFNTHYGHGILFPRPWNFNQNDDKFKLYHPAEHILLEIKKFKELE